MSQPHAPVANGDASEDATHIAATSSAGVDHSVGPDDATTNDAINEIARFWPPEAHSGPSESSPNAKLEGDQNGANSSLAVEAARYDPFKGTDLDQSRVKPPSSTRQYSAGPQNAYGNKSYPPQMAVFPGQNASRDFAQSAVRTPDASMPLDQQQQEAQSNEFADMQQDTGDRSAQYQEDGAEYTHDEHAYHEEHAGEHEHHHHHHQDAYGDASQADLTMDTHGGLGSSTPQDTSMDGDMSTASAAGMKRKKNYKYLQDEPPMDASGQRAPSEKRKKVQKACRPCKRSHMPCQEQRPCPRCIKRGIPEMCIDAEPITRRPRKYGVEAGSAAGDDSTTAGHASEIQQLARAAEAAAAAAQEAGGGEVGGTDVVAEVPAEEQKVLPSLDTMDAENLERLRKLLKPTEEDILDQFATVPLRLLANPELVPSDSPANEFEEQATSQAGGGEPKYSYTRAYYELAKWAVEKLSQAGVEKLEETIKEARSAALQAGLGIEATEVRDLEVEFQHTVSELRASTIEQVPVPMLVTRRSGEIYAVNRHAAERFGLEQPTTNDPIGNVIHLGHEKTNLRIAELLLQSMTKSLGNVVSATISFRARPTDKSDKRFVISLEARQGRGAVPLLVAITLTPLEATS